ncbi:MAG: hypothetical protein JSW27_08445, partial [Phycisphaerales bacterium]
NAPFQHFALDRTIVCTDRTAHVTYYSSGSEGTLTIYAEDVVEDDSRRRYLCSYNASALREVVPQIRSFELRVQCAGHLRDLWHRLRLYLTSKAARGGRALLTWQVVYPPAEGWCDAMVKTYRERSK